MELLNDILDIAKIEAGELRMQAVDFNLQELLYNISVLVLLRASEKGLEFDSINAPELPVYVSGDPGRLRQVLLNLTSNAVKFTDQGKITLKADVAAETDRNILLRFSVRDTGMGVPAARIPLLFQKFVRFDSSPAQRKAGPGLGLAISKELVARMDGEIGVVSEEGKGSEFFFIARFGKRPQPEKRMVPESQPEPTQEAKPDDMSTLAPDTAIAVKTDINQEDNGDIKQEVKHAQKPEVNRETKTGLIQERKPGSKQEAKPEQNPKAKTDVKSKPKYDDSLYEIYLENINE